MIINEFNEDEVLETLYKLAFSYANKNKIDDLSKEDYVQELVFYVWEKIEKYDPNKGSISTWAYMWFDSWRGNYFKSKKNTIKYLSLDKQIDDEDNECFTDLLGDENYVNPIDQIVFREIYESCNIYTKLWLTGLNYSEIAIILKCDKSTVYRNVKNNILDIKEKYFSDVYFKEN